MARLRFRNDKIPLRRGVAWRNDIRIRELQGQLLETARNGGAAYLLAYEKNLTSMLELTESAAASTQLTWAVTLANNYADFVKRVNDAVLKAGRQALG